METEEQKSNIQILIIEDEAIIAQDIADMLVELNYSVAGIINSGDKAIDYLSFHTPDLVLCDIRIKGANDGIEVAEKIRKKKKIPFVFLTSLSDKRTVERAAKTLPYGYIVKPFDQRDLLSNITMALYKFSEELKKSTISKEQVDHICGQPLTAQEYRIINAMIDGLNNQQIIETLEISKNTLKYHIKNLFAKMDVTNRAEVIHRIFKLVTTP